MNLSKPRSNTDLKNILKYSNDCLHEALANDEIVAVVTHNRQDPRKFTVICDSEYDRKLEGVELIFNNVEDYKRVFPEFSAPPPVTLGPNMELDRKSGVAVPIHKDPYDIRAVYSIPLPDNPRLYGVENILNDDDNAYWAVNKNPATIVIDLAKDSDIGTLWVKWYAGKERRSKFRVSVSTEEQFNSPERIFTIINHLDNKYSSGTTDDFEPYNLVDDPNMSVRARYIMLNIYGNTEDSNWASVTQIQVTKAVAIRSAETELLSGGEPEKKV
jgi:hypothetical protein